VLISDGEVVSEGMRRLGHDGVWLNDKLKKNGYNSPAEVFLLAADTSGVIYWTTKEM